MEKVEIPVDSFNLNGKSAALLFPLLRGGKIDRIIELDDIGCHEGVIYYSTRSQVGDVVAWTTNVNQSFAEIGILANDIDELADRIMDIQNTMHVLDSNGGGMLFDLFPHKKRLDMYPC